MNARAKWTAAVNQFKQQGYDQRTALKKADEANPGLRRQRMLAAANRQMPMEEEPADEMPLDTEPLTADMVSDMITEKLTSLGLIEAKEEYRKQVAAETSRLTAIYGHRWSPELIKMRAHGNLEPQRQRLVALANR